MEVQWLLKEGCPDNRLTFQPHQQAYARLSTEAGGLGLLWMGAGRTSDSIGSTEGILPGVLADLTGPIDRRTNR